MHVVGIRKPEGPRWRLMVVIFKTCEEAGVRIPEEVKSYFGFCKPEEAPDMVDIRGAVEKFTGLDGTGIEVRLKDLPEDVSSVRFYHNT